MIIGIVLLAIVLWLVIFFYPFLAGGVGARRSNKTIEFMLSSTRLQVKIEVNMYRDVRKVSDSNLYSLTVLRFRSKNYFLIRFI